MAKTCLPLPIGLLKADHVVHQRELDAVNGKGDNLTNASR
jgi:hypothetical protein